MRVALQNFTGGEIAPTLFARYDLARYRNSLAALENMLPGLHGDAARRPGTRFLAELAGPAVLLPFSFSAEAGQNFLLVFGERTLQIADGDGLVPGLPTLTTPYAAADLHGISHAQVGDVVYLAHPKHPLHKVVRSDAASAGAAHPFAWSLVRVAFNTTLPAPGTPTGTFSGTGDTFTLRYKVAAVDADGRQSLPSPAVAVTGARHPSDWVQGNSVTLSWQPVAGAAEYNVYREEAGYYGFIGVARGTSFSDQNYEADTADTPLEDWAPFAGGNNPAVVAFHQQRMVLAATPRAPQAFYMSRSGDFENFRKSRPLQDDDPVEYQIASGAIDAITWAASFGDLLLGTSGSEYKATGGDGGAITASNVSITAQSYWGSAGLSPIIIGNSILHVQRHGSRVRDLFYSLEKDGYAGNDLSILAPHLFEGHFLRQWAYQQSPGSTIWAVRDDGLLLALTYMKEHDIWGWSRQVTDGRVWSVASVPGAGGDTLFLVVERETGGTKRWFLERLADQWPDSAPVEEAFFVDCGLSLRRETLETTVSGLGHLEGRELAVLADGSPVEGCVVREGAIELPYPARVVQAGLPYVSALSPLPLEAEMQNGSSLGRMRAFGRCAMRLYRSVGGKYGPTREELHDLPFLPEAWGAPVEPFSGDVEFFPGGSPEGAASLWIVQDRPLPFRLTALMLDVDFAEQ
ncbi:MAG: hypothetical protein HDR50_03310 [Desulfovibrio sp.]|uniref:hypothetical protein n=1 Tax=Desulfovibrio sp. TaxID=885 RepID=UPI001A6C6AB3|nr:hypothetical protein [Desulfovibrio sp.]MBD5416694.1 hypothetical protein [Desulfovibrio sp.]